MSARLQSVWLRAITLAIALLTIAPSIFALIPLLTSGTETCGMACCRRMKSCCCRKARQHAPDSSSSKWKAAPSCTEGCRQRATLPPIVPGVAAAARPEFEALASHAAPPPTQQVQALSSQAAFAQFERPPPASC